MKIRFYFLKAKVNMSNDFPKKYSPKEFEKEIYNNWEKTGKFEPKENKNGDKFYIPMPPPNVT